jgi:hypothetical protein
VCLHLVLRSLAAILGILLATVLLNQIVVHAFRQTDRRRLHQLRVITRTTLQVVAVLAIVLILFGPPTQLSTMIGLVTAGLTSLPYKRRKRGARIRGNATKRDTTLKSGRFDPRLPIHNLNGAASLPARESCPGDLSHKPVAPCRHPFPFQSDTVK